MEEELTGYQELGVPNNSINIFTDDNVIDLGNHIVAYYLPNNEDFSSSYGYYAKDFIGDHYIAIHDIDQNEIIYFPDIYEDIAEIKLEDSGELYIQYADHNSNKKEEVHIPVTFTNWIEDDYIDTISFDNYCGKLVVSSQEGLQSGEAAIPQTVWIETFLFGKQLYEVTFERISPIYDLGLIKGGLYADYCLTVRDEKEDVIEKITIINYPIVYEEVHWLMDLSEDGFADIAFTFSDDWGMDAQSGQMGLLTLIWNQETRTYEKAIFPWSWQDRDCVNNDWSHPLWNEELSSLIAFTGNDKYGTLIMDMHSFSDGRWRRVRRLKAYYDENESPDLDNPAFLGYYELIYSADGNVVEETEIDCESGAVWFDEESVWSRMNAANLKLYPEYPQWIGDYSNVGGIEVYKYTESLYEADDKPAVHITEEPMNDECINIRTVKLEKSTEEDTVMIQYPYLTDENEISRRINEQIYNLLVPEGIEGNDGWADRADITFENTYVDDKVLSIYFTGYRDKGMSANGGNFDIGLNFDLSTGELLRLSDFYSLSEIRDLLNDAITEDKLSIVNVPLNENEFAEYVTNIFLENFEPDRYYINETNNFFIRKGRLYFLAEPYLSLAELTCIEMEIKDFPG